MSEHYDAHAAGAVFAHFARSYQIHVDDESKAGFWIKGLSSFDLPMRCGDNWMREGDRWDLKNEERFLQNPVNRKKYHLQFWSSLVRQNVNAPPIYIKDGIPSPTRDPVRSKAPCSIASAAAQPPAVLSMTLSTSGVFASRHHQRSEREPISVARRLTELEQNSPHAVLGPG